MLAHNPLPADPIEVQEQWIAGHRVSYRGRHIVAFRVDGAGTLLGFGGYQAQGIRIDGREHRFAERPLDFLAFAPVPEARRVPAGALMMIWVQGQGEVRIPVPAGLSKARVYEQGALAGSVSAETPSTVRDGQLVLDLDRIGGALVPIAAATSSSSCCPGESSERTSGPPAAGTRRRFYLPSAATGATFRTGWRAADETGSERYSPSPTTHLRQGGEGCLQTARGWIHGDVTIKYCRNVAHERIRSGTTLG